MRQYRTLLVMVMALSGLVWGTAACSLTGNAIGTQQAAAVTAQLSLPAPNVYCTSGPSKLAAAALLLHKGSEFEAGLAQLVVADGDNAEFSPVWTGGSSAFSTVAYAVYRFNLADYSGEQALYLTWPKPLADPSNIWIGFSSWNQNRWSWFAGPGLDGKLTLDTPGFTPYIKSADPGSGDMLVAVAMLGTAQATLGQLRIGTAAPAGWQHSWGTAEGEECMSTVLDPDGNVLLAGYQYYTSGGDNSADCLLAKYNSTGALKWCKRWATPYEDGLYTCATDADGNLYAVGYTMGAVAGSASPPRLLLLKYSPDGTLLWQKGYDSITDPGCSEEGRGIAIDTAGNIYLSGSTDGFSAEGAQSPILIKLNSQGDIQWARHLTKTGVAGLSLGINLAGDGALYWTVKTADTSTNWVVLKLDSSGALTWQKAYGPDTVDTEPARSFVDSNGDVYLTGVKSGTETAYVGALIKISGGGALLWQKGWDCGNAAKMCAVAEGPGGQVYACGYVEWTSEALTTALLLELQPDGTLAGQWRGVDQDWCALYDIWAGTTGELYHAGTAPASSMTWAATSGSMVDLSLSLQDYDATLEDVTGTISDLAGTDDAPPGTLDTGGGGDEMFIEKYIP